MYTLTSFYLTALLVGCDTAGKTNGDELETGSSSSDSGNDHLTEYVSPDFIGDGNVNILVLGTSVSINGGVGFSPEQVALELQGILNGDAAVTGDVNVVAEDIYTSKPITIGLGGNGAEYTYVHHRHSLSQYYHWPENLDARMDMLEGRGEHVWDYVVIASDPYVVANTPGYHALGAHKIATKVSGSGAKPLLLMVWSASESESSTSLVEEFTYRTADGAPVELPVVPAGLAWQMLSQDLQDSAVVNPSPNGAYLSAAAIYSQITHATAAASSYQYDSEIADVALTTVNQAAEADHYTGGLNFESPYGNCEVDGMDLTYNHTGSSSENGILGGLNWVFDQAEETLSNGGDPPITFNYGRANTNFEANKRYQIDPERFLYSFGFPMQDHGNHGDESMLYGLDKRDGGVVNDTDLGVARYMIDQSELPYGRAVPVRTLFALMKETNPEQSAYRDDWHMHRDLDKAIGGFMYTLLTGKCALGEEPADQTSGGWNTWMAHKTGCDTAWTMMTLESSPF